MHNEHNFELKLMASHVFCWIKVSLFIINVRKELLLLLNSNILSTLCWSFPETIAYSLQILAGIPKHQAFQKKGVLALSVSILFCYRLLPRLSRGKKNKIAPNTKDSKNCPGNKYLSKEQIKTRLFFIYIFTYLAHLLMLLSDKTVAYRSKPFSFTNTKIWLPCFLSSVFMRTAYNTLNNAVFSLTNVYLNLE